MLAQSPIRPDQAAISAVDLGLEERTIDIVLANDAHGAFVWGVLDRLLDETNCRVNGVTASGFAAMEAAVFAYGLSVGGRRGARTALANFWRRISHASVFADDRASLLRSILEQSIDLKQIRDEECPVKLGVVAANARTDAVKLFTGDQLSIDAIVAAATIPFLSPPVEIDGDAYWGEGDVFQSPRLVSAEGRHRLIIAGKPSVFTTPCPDRSTAAGHCMTKCAPVHTILDSRHRAGAPLLLRPWTDWGELTDMRDRGRQRAAAWLAADPLRADESPVAACGRRYI
ncbi:hypothetical protein RFM23_22620 [Mesorhizobium abyssinicae]|uniref:Patatin-like phospholipase family protein n=1 Tax=Mesorhizobium abyssinicae TaxID=1209958 RepID=A0ABU5ASY7_9HYPH|nr:hypothetical protein [Mesorhizobium abyssinicae]MDX8540419.1 hypothetical protein [Mesorhizobium abyssinicae]